MCHRSISNQSFWTDCCAIHPGGKEANLNRTNYLFLCIESPLVSLLLWVHGITLWPGSCPNRKLGYSMIFGSLKRWIQVFCCGGCPFQMYFKCTEPWRNPGEIDQVTHQVLFIWVFNVHLRCYKYIWIPHRIIGWKLEVPKPQTAILRLRVSGFRPKRSHVCSTQWRMPRLGSETQKRDDPVSGLL